MHQNRQGIFCLFWSIRLSVTTFWGLYRCDPGGIFNACDTVLKILRLKFDDRLKIKALNPAMHLSIRPSPFNDSQKAGGQLFQRKMTCACEFLKV